MEIESRLVHCGNDGESPVFYTEVARDDGTAALVTTVVMGSATNRHFPRTTKRCIDRFMAIHEKTFPDGIIYLVELATLDNVDAKVEKSLHRAQKGSAIVYLCNEAPVYERVIFDLFLNTADEPASLSMMRLVSNARK